MARPATASGDTSSAAQGRFTVQLPKELEAVLDGIGADMQSKVASIHGFAPEFSRAQVVQSLAHAHQQRQRGETPPPAPEPGDGGDGGDSGAGNGGKASA